MSFTSFLDGTRWTDVHAATACSFLSGTAMFTAQFTLALRLQSNGHGGAAVAALIICTILPVVLLAPLTGRMADRFDSRTLMACGGLLQAAAIAAMPFTDGLPLLLASVFVNAAANSVMRTALGALVPTMATADDLPRAIAMVQTGLLIGLAAGPATAGFIVAAQGTGAALAGAACCAAVAGLLACDIRTRRGGVRRAAVTGKDGTAAPDWFLRRDVILLVMVVGASAVVGALSAINVLEVFLVREVYGASESVYGLINACWTGGMAIGAWIAAAVFRRVDQGSKTAWLLMGCLAATGLTVMAMGSPLPAVGLLIPLYLIGGILNATENSCMQISVARRVPERFRGRAAARIGGVINAATLVGFTAGGALESVLAVRTAFVVIGLTAIVIVVICLPMIRRGIRAEHADQAPEPVMAAA